jgi:hypothetical protein
LAFAVTKVIALAIKDNYIEAQWTINESADND